MKHFSGLTEFVKYCEQINEKQEDSPKFLLTSIFAFCYDKDELMEDINEALEEYYKWQAIAVEGEYYSLAGCILNAKEAEMNHYIQLAKSSLKINLKKDITQLDSKIKFKYLAC